MPPAKAIQNAPEVDPALQVPGMPPNYGQFAVPHVMTLQGLVSSISRTYRASDEALKNSLDHARFMRNDVGILECVEARQRSVALLDWHLEPEDANSQEQKDLAEEMTKILRRIPRFTQYRETQQNAIWFGKYGIQNKYNWRDVGGRMRVFPTAWKPLHGDKIVYRIDDDEQVGIRVGQHWSAGANIAERVPGAAQHWQVEPTDRGMAYFLKPYERATLLIHRHQVEDAAFEAPEDADRVNGIGIRSKIYWEWFQKQEALAWLMEFLERSAFGFEIWYFPMGHPTARADMEKAANERIGQGRNIILVPKPPGEEHNYGVERIEPGFGGVDAVQNLLNGYYGHRIKRYILGQTLTSEADATGLGSDLASVQLGTFMDIVKYDATNAEESLTTDLVAPVQRWNFPRSAHIHLRFVLETSTPDAEKKLAAFRQAFDMGARIKESDVMEAVGAAIPTDADRVLQNEWSMQLDKSHRAAHPEDDMARSLRDTLNHPEGAPELDAVQPGHAQQITNAINERAGV